jgi:hypothetical protein
MYDANSLKNASKTSAKNSKNEDSPDQTDIPFLQKLAYCSRRPCKMQRLYHHQI